VLTYSYAAATLDRDDPRLPYLQVAEQGSRSRRDLAVRDGDVDGDLTAGKTWAAELSIRHERLDRAWIRHREGRRTDGDLRPPEATPMAVS